MLQNQPQTSTTRSGMMRNYHNHKLSPNQCSSTIVQSVNAPLPLVWSLVRQFDNPQSYKQFIKSCTMRVGDGGSEGSVREVVVMSGLPAESSIERLDKQDDEAHVMVFSIIGGDHQLANYRSTTTLHEEEADDHEKIKTVVIESYVVDIPAGSCQDDTCSFADTIVRCNLRSLARVSERMACDH